MLCWILIVGGLLIMMGQHDRSEALFYYFRLEDQVPENHLLRLIDKHISFEFVREQLKNSYSETGRPSIDPELLLRILLIGYLYGITSERKLVEELRMHLAWRWFTGLSFDQEIPHHSTFSKNRHGRFQDSKLFEQLFEQIVRQCMEVGLVQGQELSVDGSFVEANAAKQSRIPREQLVEAAQVHQTLRQYLQELEQQNPVEEPVHEQDLVSITDPDSTYATKGGTPARLGYYDNYLVDNPSSSWQRLRRTSSDWCGSSANPCLQQLRISMLRANRVMVGGDSPALLLQLGVLGFRFFKDGNVGIGVFPEREEILVTLARSFLVAAEGAGTTQL